MTVEVILRDKGSEVSTIRPEVAVGVAVNRLKAENIGALVVSESGEDIAGILSERDVVLNLATHGAALLDRPVRDIMTSPVRTCRPDDEIGALMVIMTRFRIRHLPVEIDGKLGGIVSIGDVVKKRLSEVEFERDVMRDWYMATP